MEIREVKLWERFKTYFNLVTGFDISDDRIEKINPIKINVSDKWNDECHKQLPELEQADRVEWGLMLLNGSPKIVNGQEENVIIEDGAVIFKT